jgi:hypothetical protein
LPHRPLNEFFKVTKKSDAQLEYFNRLLVNMIAIDMSAFSVVRNQGFVDLCGAFGYNTPHRKTVTEHFKTDFKMFQKSRGGDSPQARIR